MLCPWLFSETNFGTKISIYKIKWKKQAMIDAQETLLQKYFYQFGMADEESDSNKLEELL